MNFRSLTVLAILACSSVIAAEPLKQFKVMSWNMENFTDPFDDPYIDNEAENLGASKKDSELRDIALEIKNANPDVIAFQEVEGDRAMKFFLDEYLPDHGYKYFAGAASMDWSQNNVVASRFPLGPITSFREIEMYNEVLDRTDNKYNPRLLMVEVRPTPEYSFLLVDLHLKAGRDKEDPVWRGHQIDLIHDYLAARTASNPDLDIMIVGDMNFEPNMPEYAHLTVEGPIEFVDPLANTGTLTHSSRVPTRQLDYIFFSGSMRPQYVEDSAGVALSIGLDKLSRLSDHLPVIATFTVEE